MNWAAVLQYAVSGAIVSWPVFIAGIWVNRRHVSKVTAEQTEKIAELTDAQTDELTRRRHEQPVPPYHQHGEPHR